MHPAPPPFRKMICRSVILILLATIGFGSAPRVGAQAATGAVELPKSMHAGAKIQFELWTWEDDVAVRRKIRDLNDGDKVPLEGLPDSVQFRFRVLADHNGIAFKGWSADGEHRLGWHENDLKTAPNESAAEKIYRAQPDGYFPQPGRYALEVKGLKDGATVAESVVNLEFTRAPRKPLVRGATYAGAVGGAKPLPKAMQSGAAIGYELWQWGKDSGQAKLMDLKDGAKIAVETLPHSVQFQFRANAEFDAITCSWFSTDSSVESTWAQKNLTPEKSGNGNLYRSSNLGFFPQIGKYALTVKAEKAGKVVAQGCINLELVSNRPVPANTAYLAGKKDWKGNAITTSKPVVLGGLNETAVLKDNDYAFEPQKAVSVINWERFPPFHLNARFPLVWSSRRFADEDKFGGPLSRGFTTLANIDNAQDNLRISERSWFHYPGQLLGMIDSLLKKDPVKYHDLKAWKDRRSAFISPENATLLGKMCYEGWGVAGWGPYDPGIYGWDEEEMFAPIAKNMMKEHPEELPERLMKYREKVQAGDAGATQALEREYDVAMAEFVGDTYKGARESAALRGRALKIWHYGSKAPGRELFTLLGGPQGAEINPKTGKYRYEEIDGLHEWFRKGRAVNFEATSFAREIDYFHTDFYFHINFPQAAGLYEKDANGYVLDEKGRRKIRRDMITEEIYAQPTKIGLEDFKWGPVFLKSFIAKEENNQFWFNGGKYYKTPGTQITDKQMGPYIRPGTQETFGEIAKLGSRPVNPYMAEATTILTFMMGTEALFVWDEPRKTTPVGQTNNGRTEIFGDLEYAVKGLHRVSQFNRLFDGNYSFIRPVRHYNTHDCDHPIIRGLVNGQYLVLAMLNPSLDVGETQEVEVWYDCPYAARGKGKWAGKATIQARKTHLFQCKLPALAGGYDPDKLYFRYKLEDGKYTRTFTVTGNYEVGYPYGE
jgi:hypothetical protein